MEQLCVDAQQRANHWTAHNSAIQGVRSWSFETLQGSNNNVKLPLFILSIEVWKPVALLAVSLSLYFWVPFHFFVTSQYSTVEEKHDC